MLEFILGKLLATPIIGALLQPIVNGLLTAQKQKLDAAGSHEARETEIAIKAIDLDKREAELQADYKRALIGHPFEPANVAAYIFVLYIAKVVVWDTMLGLGSTPAIKGNVGEWMALIAAFLFGKRGAENLAMIVSGALKRK
jgi:hypothetical protein